MQNVTGLYINHYMGIGFGGFVSVVNAVGGVHMCLPGPMVDPKAGLNLKAGCQILDGDQALGYVRTRNFALSDLQREQDQRLFLKALLRKMTSPTVLLNPFAIIPAATGSANTLTVTRAPTSISSCRWRSRSGTRRPPPCRSPTWTSRRRTTAWPCSGTRARRCSYSTTLKTDTPLPPSLITGSKAAGTQ